MPGLDRDKKVLWFIATMALIYVIGLILNVFQGNMSVTYTDNIVIPVLAIIVASLVVEVIDLQKRVGSK